MHLFLNQLKNATLCVGAVAIAWLLFFKLNSFIFSYLETNQFVSLVFMPAGIRLVSVLLLEEYAVIGLFIGALLTSPMTSVNLTQILIISLISALNPYLAVHTTKYLLKIDNLLNNLSAKELILMGIFSAGLNCISHHLYFYLTDIRTSWADCASMFVGDLLGISIMLFLFSMGLKFIRRSTLSTIAE